MENNRLLTDHNYLIRSIVENNPIDVLKKLDSYGYKGSEDVEDLIASVKYLVNIGEKQKALDVISVDFIPSRFSSALKEDLKYIAKLKLS